MSAAISSAPITPLKGFLVAVLKPYHKYLIGLVGVAILWAALLCLKPQLLKWLLDALNSDPFEVYRAAVYPALAYLVVCFLDVLLFRFYDWLSLLFFPRLKAQMIEHLAFHITGQSHAYYQTKMPGSLISHLQDITNGVQELINIVIDRFLGNFLVLLFATLTFAWVSPILGAVLVLWITFFIIFSTSGGKKLSEYSRMAAVANSTLMGKLGDVLINMSAVRLFGRRKFEMQNLEVTVREFVKKDTNMLRFMMQCYSIQGLSFVVMLGICLAYLLYAKNLNLVTVGDFALILNLSLTIMECMLVIAQDFSTYNERLGKVSQGIIELTRAYEITENTESQLSIKEGAITFDSVKFHYKYPKPLFENLNVHIPGGQKVGLVGFSGSGKTTFVNLLLRLFDIQSGSIKIDSQNIALVTQDSLRKAIGVIPQDISLFQRNLLENIRYGKIDSTDAEVIEAAKKAHAHEFIIQMEKGYQTEVGERGLKLSGGQRQRIAIARAILKNAPILILDEATSALDPLTEQLIQESLNHLMENKTTIIVAHRLSTLQHVDRILVFEEGRIVEDGSHQALLENPGLYRRLWDSQVKLL